MLAAEFDVLRRRVQVWQSFEWDGESCLTAILNRICALAEHVSAFISFGFSSLLNLILLHCHNSFITGGYACGCVRSQ